MQANYFCRVNAGLRITVTKLTVTDTISIAISIPVAGNVPDDSVTIFLHGGSSIEDAFRFLGTPQREFDETAMAKAAGQE